MTLLEYIKQLAHGEKVIYTNELGQIHIKTNDIDELWDEDKIDMHTYNALDEIVELFKVVDARYRYMTPCRVPPEIGEIMFTDTLILDEAQTKLMNTLEIIEDPEVKGYESTPKYPYYRLRGKPVTPEQALDIIRRTDKIFVYKAQEAMGPDYIGTLNFTNDWFKPENGWSSPFGWVHPDGTIGINTVTTKYPNWSEFLYEILGYKMAFPYLDFVIVITDWDNFPDYVRGDFNHSSDYREKVDSDYPDFLEHVKYGIWVHDNTIEFMKPSRARAKYQEYVTRYGLEDTSKYISGYYKREAKYNSKEYLKQCTKGYDLNLDQVIDSNDP